MPVIKGYKYKLCRRGHEMQYCGKEIHGRWRCQTCYKLTCRIRSLRTNYGITIKQYEDIMTKYNHTCAICSNKANTKLRMHLDHNHTTGKIRGVLCQHCNQGIGHFRDNIQILDNAIKYLKEHNNVT